MHLFLLITGFIFAVVGIYALIDPVAALATPVGLSLDGTGAYNQLRASAGAVPLVAGLFMMGSFKREDWVNPALWLIALLLGGLLLGRAISLVVDGMPGSTNLTMMGFEFFGWIQAVFWLRINARPLSEI